MPDRRELPVAVALGVSVLASLALVAAFLFLDDQPQVEGILLGPALGGLGLGIAFWAIRLIDAPVRSEERHDMASSGEERRDAEAALELEGITRRSFLVKLLVGAGATLVAALALPAFSLGPQPGRSLFRTAWGLRTRAIGEHPRAADTMGINVNRLRYMNVFFAGLVAGLAGAWFSLEATFNFDDLMTNGRGFIALAAMIFGKYTPFGALSGALIFSSADALQIKIQGFDFALPAQFLQMLPYVITVIVLAGVIGRSRPPAALGKPYEK